MQGKRPMAYFSKSFQGRNLLLSTYEKELMALVSCTQKWRHYLLGRHFVVRTDHSSLKYLWDQKLTTSAQHKWLIKLTGFDFHGDYEKGVDNCVVDALSRRFEFNRIFRVLREQGRYFTFFISCYYIVDSPMARYYKGRGSIPRRNAKAGFRNKFKGAFSNSLEYRKWCQDMRMFLRWNS